ncbi:hypothetical protein GCM10022399_41250 [Terrabacter ginsenosidimutans]|uniref:Uncharacterized protein n=1 Tax=Terrabacter ginsenosidimutans TaxID=490575 RepID=A0ABP7EKU0_9MICO
MILPLPGFSPRCSSADVRGVLLQCLTRRDRKRKTGEFKAHLETLASELPDDPFYDR